MKKQRILVTGGAGFIGSNTVKLLCDLGMDVVVFDNLSFGYKDLVDKRAKFIEGDLLDKKAINEALIGVDKVFHFAAISIIKQSIDDPVFCFKTNIEGIVNLLEAMRVNGVQYIVNSSSASVYGNPEVVPVTEDSGKAPIQPYGASKLAVEAILSSYYHTYGINSTSLRYFNAYGPNDEQQPVTRAVPTWIKAILKHQPIPLYWKGNQLRDYVFVEDIAKAHIDVMDMKGFNYFNIGSGNGILIKELLEKIFEKVGYRTEIIDKGERQGDPKILVADISKIEKIVGWKPSFDLDEGLDRTIEYYRQAKVLK